MAEEKLEPEVIRIFEHIQNGENFLLSGGAGSGKTYSLVQVIKKAIADNPTAKVACMTYTNAAVKEIEERVGHDNLNVSTIHDFLWDNIKTFKKELKKSLIALLNDDTSGIQKPYDEGVIDNLYFDNIEDGIQYKEYLRIKEGIISHDEVLILANYMFGHYPLLCDILKDKFKFIFIDEYQDTNPIVVEIFLTHFKQSKKKNIIGFFGDAMQSIYEDGIGDLGQYIVSNDVVEVLKSQNRRNPQLVIDLANKLRTDRLQQEPSADEKAPNMLNGIVKQGNIKFLYSFGAKLDTIKDSAYFSEWNFNNAKQTKELNLTHNLIAPKAGFTELMDIYDKDEVIKYLSLLRKFIKMQNFSYSDEISLYDLSKKIQEKIETEISNLGLNSFTVLKYIENLKQKYPEHSLNISVLLNQIKPIKDNTIKEEQKSIISQFKNATGIQEIDFIYQIKLMKDIQKGVDENYIDLFDTIKNVPYVKVKNLYVDKDQLIDDKKQDEYDENKKGSKRDRLIKHLFKIQTNIHLYKEKRYNEFLRKTEFRINSIADKQNIRNIIADISEMSDYTIEDVINIADEKGICRRDDSFNQFVENNQYLYNRVKSVKFQEFQNLYYYLEGFTPFSTQHKTKGTEFDNVLVVLDNGKWNDYNFEYLFTDRTDKPSVLARTQKIFYVCCTRAKENLIVYFDSPSDAVIAKAKNWFGENNIKDISNLANI